MKNFKLVLFLFLLSGAVLAPSQSKAAFVQIVNNSGDAKVSAVDIWVNNVRTFQNIQFRKGTAFTQINALSVSFAVTAVGAADTSNAMLNKTYSLGAINTYIMMLNGIASKTGYSPIQPLDFAVYDKAKIQSSDANKTEILVLHGSTDSPALDIWETKFALTKLVDNIKYNEFNGYLSMPTEDYQFELRLNGSMTAIAKYDVPLKSLGAKGFALAIFASGFSDKTKNSNGADLGLFAVLLNGTVVPLPPANSLKFAKAQIIHNSADTSLKAVDVWINNSKAFPNLNFRNATGFNDIPAGLPVQMAVTRANSKDTMGALKQFNYNLNADARTIIIIDGIASTTGYSSNKPFSLMQYAFAKDTVDDKEKNEVLFYHGVTDGPTVDVNVANKDLSHTLLVSNTEYGNFYGYNALPYDDFKVQFSLSVNQNLLATYDAKFKTLGLKGKSFTVVASGFADSTMNSNGPAFKLMAYDNLGTAIEFPSELINSVDYTASYSNGSNVYPNPSSGNTMLKLDLNSANNLKLELFDSFGKSVYSTEFNNLVQGENHLNLNLKELPSGVYRYTANNGKDNIIGSISILK